MSLGDRARAGADLRGLLAEQRRPQAELALALQGDRLAVDPPHEHHVAVHAPDIGVVDGILGMVDPLAFGGEELDGLGSHVPLLLVVAARWDRHRRPDQVRRHVVVRFMGVSRKAERIIRSRTRRYMPHVAHPIPWCITGCSPERTAHVAKVIVDVMLKPEIHDPQGEAVLSASRRLGFGAVTGVRQGKRFELEIDGPADDVALAAVEELARELLANPVIEEFAVHTTE